MENPMAGPDQAQLDPGEDGSEGPNEYDQLREQLNQQVSRFAEEHDLSFNDVSLLLIDLGISSRMLEYVFSVEKPSGSGLKLDLDRLRREIEDYLRGCKRNADEFVREMKDIIGSQADVAATETDDKP
jgi:hypothetical protein